MKKKECPSCAMMIDSKSTICPVCSYEFPRSQSALKWIAILLALFFLLLIFLT